MKIDPQHMLPAHIPFYKRRLFWGVVLFLIVSISHIYIAMKYTTDPKILWTTNISLMAFMSSAVMNSGTFGVLSTLVAYTYLLYFALCRKEINFYTLTILVILLVWSFFFTIDFLENFV